MTAEKYEAPEMARRAAMVIASNALHRALWREHPRTMRRMFIAGRCEAPRELVIVKVPAPERAPEQPSPPSPAPVVERPRPRVGVATNLIDRVADAMGCSHGEIVGGGRALQFVAARALVARILRDRGWSTTQIGRVLRRDHSTVCHLLARWPYWAERYPGVAAFHERWRGEA